MIEIERKFLVKSNQFKNESFENKRIIQGYILKNNRGRSVRIRIKGNQGYITIKGASDKSGISRFEWEKVIPIQEAEQLLKLCDPEVIDKTRYLVNYSNHLFEIDEFHGDNKGLIIAEIELNSENEEFEKPEWLGPEVTGDIRYYNSQLSTNPYKKW